MTVFGETLRSFIPSALAVGLALTIAADVSARPWKPEGKAAAQDYTQIIHNKSNTEVIMIWWLVPQILPATPPGAVELLDDHVIVGIADGHVAPNGAMTFAPIDHLSAADGSGHALKALSGTDMPATVSLLVTTLQAVLGKAAGAMGQGIRWFVFEGGAVHSCGLGALAIAYEGELYTYDTPIPGCPKV
jgi:hypothetical protein